MHPLALPTVGLIKPADSPRAHRTQLSANIERIVSGRNVEARDDDDNGNDNDQDLPPVPSQCVLCNYEKTSAARSMKHKANKNFCNYQFELNNLLLIHYTLCENILTQ